MAGKVPRLSPWGGPRRVKGIAHEYYSPFFQRWILRSWPKGQGEDSAMRALGRETFSAVVNALKGLPGEERDASAALAANSPYLDRDLQYKAATGTLLQFTDDTGRLWMSTRIAIQSIQPMLDSISNAPGTILFRNAAYWDALAPPAADDVMMFNVATGKPEWVDATTAIQLLLDDIGATQGSVLYRGASAWHVLAPGTDTSVLTTHGAGANPTWAAAYHPNAGSGAQLIFPTGASGANAGFAALGNVFQTGSRVVNIFHASMLLTTVTGGVYKMGIAPWNASTKKITSAPTYADASYTEAAGAAKLIGFTWAAGMALAASSDYLIFIVRTDSTSSVGITANFISNSLNAAPVGDGIGVTVTGNNIAKLASLAPLTTDVWTTANATFVTPMTYSF